MLSDRMRERESREQREGGMERGREKQRERKKNEDIKQEVLVLFLYFPNIKVKYKTPDCITV